MSEQRQPSPRKTDTFAKVLNNTLMYGIQQMNEGSNLQAFKVFRNVTRMLKIEDRKFLMSNGFTDLEKEIASVMNLSGVDYETTRIKQRAKANRLLGSKIGDVFETLMERLHKKGYLEEQRRQRIAKPDFQELENED